MQGRIFSTGIHFQTIKCGIILFISERKVNTEKPLIKKIIDRHDDVNVLEGMYPLREHDTTFHLKVCRDNDRDQDKSMSFTAWEVQQPAMLGKYCSQQGKSVKMQWLGCWTLNQQLTTKTVSSELWLFALNFVERNDIFTWTHRPIIALCKVFPIAQHCTI